MDKETGGLKFSGIKPLQSLGGKAKALAFSSQLYRLTLNGEVPETLLMTPPNLWPGDINKGRDLLAGRYCFAGESVESKAVLWEPHGVGEDWLSVFHGFDWLRDLKAVGGDQARRKARSLVTDWINNYDKWHEVSWRADVLGERIASWISFYDFFGASADDFFQERFFDSLACQIRHLSRVMPGQLRGMELLRALKGLLYGGLCLDGYEDQIDQSLDLILEEIKQQVLPDGCHVSRCPERHLSVVRYLIDIRTSLASAKEVVPPEISLALSHMVPVLKFFRHGDGGLSMFNGTISSSPMLCEAAITHSNIKGRFQKSLSSGGFERMSQSRTTVIMDTGSPPPQKYSRQAHAGALSFEMSCGRERVIVNCGASPQSGPWKEALRATAAHSTVVIDDRNSSAIGTDGFITNAPDVLVNRREENGECLIEAEHAGYMARYGVKHRRVLSMGQQGEFIQGVDQLIGAMGVAFSIRFHLHPSVNASLIQQGQEVLLRTRNGVGWRMSAAGAPLLIEESVYLGQDEELRRTMQIVLRGKIEGEETYVQWLLQRERR